MSSKKLKKPGQTKLSVQRQMISLGKRLERLTLFPDEVLYRVFQYLDTSDLLRCSCVCKQWKCVSDIEALWELQFQRLPKSCSKFSTDAKKVAGPASWQKEVFHCVKTGMKKRMLKLIENKSSLSSAVKARNQATKTFHIQWQLSIITDRSQLIKINSDDNFIFNRGISVRWNNPDNVALLKIKSIDIFALIPLFHDKQLTPVRNSVCSRSLLLQHSFKDHRFKVNESLHKADEVTIYCLQRGFYVGLWNSSLPKEACAAFFLFTIPVHGLLEKICYGLPDRIYEAMHTPVIDDVDRNYGKYGYRCELEIRNSRKSFFFEIYNDIRDGTFEGSDLVISKERFSEHVFYDMREKIQFTWRSGAIRGTIPDMAVIDILLTDYNGDIIWAFSTICSLQKERIEKANYSYDNCEIWSCSYDESQRGSCIIKFIKNGKSNEATVKSITFRLKKSLINSWFGTRYLLHRLNEETALTR